MASCCAPVGSRQPSNHQFGGPHSRGRARPRARDAAAHCISDGSAERAGLGRGAVLVLAQRVPSAPRCRGVSTPHRRLTDSHAPAC